MACDRRGRNGLYRSPAAENLPQQLSPQGQSLDARCFTPSGRVRAEQRLDLEEVSQSVLAPFAPVTRALEAAEWRIHIPAGTVQYDLPRADPSAYLACPRRVLGPDVGGEPIRRVVGDADRLFFIVVRQNAQDGPEDLFASNDHVVCHVRENRRPDEVSLCKASRPARAADYDFRPRGDALRDEDLDAIELNL